MAVEGLGLGGGLVRLTGGALAGTLSVIKLTSMALEAGKEARISQESERGAVRWWSYLD